MHLCADFDAYDTGAFEPQALEHWQTTVAPHVQHVAGGVQLTDTTNLRWPADESAIRFVQLVDFRVRPDRQQAFFEAVAKVHQAIVQTNYPLYYAFNTAVAGGNGNVIRLAIPYESWADMAPPETAMGVMLTEVYGAEEAQSLQEQFNAVIVGSTSTVLMLRRDLPIGLGGVNWWDGGTVGPGGSRSRSPWQVRSPGTRTLRPPVTPSHRSPVRWPAPELGGSVCAGFRSPSPFPR